MVRTAFASASICAALLVGGAAAQSGEGTSPSYVLGHEMPRLDGSVESLDKYEGKVLLLINVASFCGFTPQYAGLQKMYEELNEEGFEILAFPANNFRNQEPGSNQEISEFCNEKYGVTFPMFSKISVMGKDQHPLYAQITGQPEPVGGPVVWNFQKYLVDRSGNVVAKFSMRVKPEDPELVGKIKELLASSKG